MLNNFLFPEHLNMLKTSVTLFPYQTRALNYYMQITTMTANSTKQEMIYLTNSAAPVFGEFYAAANGVAGIRCSRCCCCRSRLEQEVTVGLLKTLLM
jgi:hypothetical protein